MRSAEQHEMQYRSNETAGSACQSCMLVKATESNRFPHGWCHDVV